VSALLLGIGIPVVYFGEWLYMARRLYGRWRPYTEPLNCECSTYYRDGEHHTVRCYRRSVSIDTAGEAAAFAALAALLWPFILPYLLLARFIVAGAKPTTEELKAKIKRLEMELDQSWEDR
jgi:hypothetical protein